MIIEVENQYRLLKKQGLIKDKDTEDVSVDFGTYMDIIEDGM